MSKLSYRVLITTSGTGSRLKHLTKNNNKSLVKVKGKAVITHIVESYPENIELVVTLGYYGDKVKKFLKNNYPKRKLIFINVDKFEGPGSSLGYSMLQAKEHLSCPFILHCNDTIVLNPIPEPNKNWNGGSKGLDPLIFNSQFISSFTIKNGRVKKLQSKGAESYDYFHIGLVGINDYQNFWKYLEKVYSENPGDSTLNDCSSIRIMIDKKIPFALQIFEKWYDTGNLKSLAHARKNINK